MSHEFISRRQFAKRTASVLSGLALGGCAWNSTTRTTRRYGVSTEYERLKRVLVHAPSPAVGDLPTADDLERHHFDAQLDHARAVAEHAALTRLLREQGAEVIEIREVLSKDAEAVALIDSDPNFMFTRDIIAMTPAGALMMRMGLPARRPEVAIVRKAVKRLGIPVVGELKAPATLEGGSVMWLDSDTLIIGKCDRTHDQAIDQVRSMMAALGIRTLLVANIPGRIHIDGVLAIPGPGTVFVRPEAFQDHKADVFTRASHRQAWFLDELEELGQDPIALERICNEIYTAPFVGVAVSAWARDDAKRNLEACGGRLRTFVGGELIKGNGGAHCLTCPLWREGA